MHWQAAFTPSSDSTHHLTMTMSMCSPSVDSLSMGPLTSDPVPIGSQSTRSRSIDSRASECPTPDLCQIHQGSSGTSRLLVKLSDVVAHGLPELSLLQRHSHTFDLTIRLGGRSETRRAAEFRDGVFRWNEHVYFTDVHGSADLELQVISEHHHDHGRTQKSTMSALRFDQTGAHDEHGCMQHRTRTWRAVLRRPLLGAAFYRHKGKGRGAEIEFTLAVTTLGSRVWLERRCTGSSQGSRQGSLASQASRR
ncbi:hypothetical protein CONPUDRAFT_165357 [Coniophora puteana RWD-64-598 SS2]|uniref:C2 domain-containing protein n=1 Tax=Coniophora puteana (strain RWD-64-598) TaxID=741705 RepID=A0A5M3MPZ0_CONPW|nr:uncharacterized protein CONPUDRAFT_165357 [Coniophora puteana RWD-64-598 SS2]EIW81140.1 hypothetical protein CONPUDRAFT_165357 [Coniophora puteana RWD-64-598 SS2]